ncbi:hypothetical protein EJ06DRAFT_62206 [Trichodelitschia bisporula]|uniref:F-box domain-containing protein n=1 Tax=Trichodelitschia bisporula TaxID=703511 RepID=A0A6G1HUJ1_9PEZI|nr:hypothetical protein EJ06DRAFT_62206 [Trichodelitschia bisporula]
MQDFLVTTAVLLLPNLRSLGLGFDICWNAVYSLRFLPDVIACDLGRTVLQDLTAVSLGPNTFEDGACFHKLAPFLLLPRLTVLKASRIQSCKRCCQQYSWNLKRPIAAPLAELVLHDTRFGSPNGLYHFLEPLKFLHSFTLECWHLERNSRDLTRPAPVVSPPWKDQKIESMDEPRLGAEDFCAHFDTPIPLESLSESPLDVGFKASEFLNCIADTHGRSLKQLKFTYLGEAGIPRSQQILHFNRSSRLTHLEYSAQMVRPSRAAFHTPRGTRFHPRSLTGILPPSIKDVRIHVGQVYCHMRPLLWRIPHERERVPQLRKVIFYHQMSAYGDEPVDIKGHFSAIHDMTRLLVREVGVRVSLRERYKSNIGAWEERRSLGL